MCLPTVELSTFKPQSSLMWKGQMVRLIHVGQMPQEDKNAEDVEKRGSVLTQRMSQLEKGENERWRGLFNFEEKAEAKAKRSNVIIRS